MAANRNESVPRKPGRPASTEVREQCRDIGRLLARGMGELEIRHELGLSCRTFRQRMAYLRKTSIDTRWIWTKFLAAQQSDIRTLSEIADRALSSERPALRAATDAILAKSRLRREALEVGEKPGIYDNPAQHDPVYYENPTMSLFLDAAEQVGEFAENREGEPGAAFRYDTVN